MSGTPQRHFSHGVFTIHASFGFAASLSRLMLNLALEKDKKNWQAALADMTLYLPNRRSVGVVKGALLQAVQDEQLVGGYLMPKIISLGDIVTDSQDLEITSDDDDFVSDGALSPISQERRLQLLMSLIQKFYHQGFDRHLTAGHLLGLAKKLASFLDELTIAQKDRKELFAKGIFLNNEELIGDEADDNNRRTMGDADSKALLETLAEHWQKILRFLTLVVPSYENILQERGHQDREQILNERIIAIADAYQRAQHTGKQTGTVIIAGSTGSRATTRQLMRSVLTLPHGMVILPGFDKNMDEDVWDFLSSSVLPSASIEKKLSEKNSAFFLSALVHPQRSMVDLLQFLGVKKNDVKYLHHESIGHNILAREKLLAEIFLPPIKTWLQRADDKNLQKNIATALGAVTMLTLPDRSSEAEMIALIIKKNLINHERNNDAAPNNSVKNPSQPTIALVARDKQLIREVLLVLRSMNILVEDSSGVPFWQSPLGMFVFIANLFFSRPSAATFKNLLLQPLVSGASSETKQFVHYLLVDVLPTIRHHLTAEKLQRAIIAPPSEPGSNRPDRLDATQRKKLLQWLEPMMVVLQSNEEKTRQPKSVAAWMGEFINFIQLITRDSIADDRDNILASSAGKKFYTIVNHFIAEGEDNVFFMQREELHDWFYELLAGETIHRPFLQLARLQIVGPLESRLLKADITILAGLTDGIWPATGSPDPWLPKSVRRHWGLLNDEEKLSLSAHDFATNFLSPEVFLLSREKENGVLCEKSRWLQRLEALLTIYPQAAMQQRAAQWYGLLARHQQLSNQFLSPAATTPPAPQPAVAARPKKLSVTSLEKFQSNPFWLYANKILKLPKPDDLSDDSLVATLARDKGKLLHDILKIFTAEASQHQGRELVFLYELCDRALADYQHLAVVKNFWQPAFYATCDFFWREYQHHASGKILSEFHGEATTSLADYHFTLTARADRIDIKPDGGINIVDYKTGPLPTQTKRQAGESLQLPLEGWIATRGGFTGISPTAAAQPIELEFWHLRGDDSVVENFSKSKKNNKTNEELIAQAEEKLLSIVSNLANPAFGFTAVEGQEYNDYDLLAREGEWASGIVIEKDGDESPEGA